MKEENLLLVRRLTNMFNTESEYYLYFVSFVVIALVSLVEFATLKVTVVYVQITLLWRYFTLEITLGSKKNYTDFFSAITNCQT